LLKSFTHLLTNPLVNSLLLGLLAWVFLKLKWDLLAQLIWILSGLWLFICLFTPLPSYLLGKMERSIVQVFDSKEVNDRDKYNILVFASGFTNDTSLQANTQLGETMLQRVVEGVRLYNDLGAKELILSGPCKDGGGCQAKAAATVARSMRVPSENTAIITAGHNTIEELETYIAEYGKENRLIAVSSARHLKRIKLIANNLGLEVELSASDYEIKIELGRSNAFQPGFKGTGYTQMFLHEWLGMWYTRWYFWRSEITI
jgi:uncharacterized SAM-binding protein YcdF (DUF218 family)